MEMLNQDRALQILGFLTPQTILCHLKLGMPFIWSYKICTLYVMASLGITNSSLSPQVNSYCQMR